MSDILDFDKIINSVYAAGISGGMEIFMSRDLCKNAVFLSKNHRHLSRARLNNLLSTAIKGTLVTVIAGTGYGKTQAVSMFLRHNCYKVSWMQLSELDNLPIRFWEKFLYASPLNRESIEEHLEQFPESLMEFSQFLEVFNKSVQTKERQIFVFDDFHLIYNETVISFFNNLVNAKIKNLCILLISRTNIRFANIFNYSLLESDLRFTFTETKEYFKMMAINLSISEIKKIQENTEGWPFIIYLLALDLQGNNTSMIDSLANIKSFVFQMIETDIFSLYTRQWQKLLIKLSLLNEFSVDLLVELTGDKNIETVINTLNSNVFIHYNLHNEKYYFHQIFLDFLRKKQIYLEPHVAKNVYLTAAQLYSKQGANINAITYYEKCEGHDKIWDIILSMPHRRQPKDIASLLINILNNFPEGFMRKNPLIRVVCAAYMLNNLDFEPAKKNVLELIGELAVLPKTKKNSAIIGEAYIILAFINLIQKNHDFVENFKRADACLPEGSMFNYSQVKMIDSNYAFFSGMLKPEEIQRLQKDFLEVSRYASKVMHGFGYGIEYLFLAEHSFFTGDLKKSQEYAFESIYRARQKSQHDIYCNGYFLLMRINAAKGKYETIIDCLNQLKEYIQTSPTSSNILDIAESWFLILIGQYDNVASWLLNESLNEKLYPPISIGKDRIIRAYYFLEKGAYDELLPFTKWLEYLFHAKVVRLDLITIRIFKALSFLYINNMPKCIEIIRSIYEIAYDNHFTMQFIEMGRHTCLMIDKIRKVENHGLPDEWLNSIYAKAATYGKRQAYLKSKYNSMRILENNIHITKREKEILNELCQGLTRDEISDSLNISINTVKSGLKNVYGKLGAANSAEAVRIAIQLNLI